MSGSNRGIYIAFGVAGTFALAIAAYVGRDAHLKQVSYEQQAEQNAKAYHDYARIHAQRRCSDLPSPAKSECMHEQHHAARERARQEYDLKAQLVMSVWTRAMGIAAIIAMIVGIVGVGLVYTTFRETRRTANTAKDSFDRQFRSYVFAEELAGTITGIGPARIELKALLRNGGQAFADLTVFAVDVGWNVGTASGYYEPKQSAFRRGPWELGPGVGHSENFSFTVDLTNAGGLLFITLRYRYGDEFDADRGRDVSFWAEYSRARAAHGRTDLSIKNMGVVARDDEGLFPTDENGNRVS